MPFELAPRRGVYLDIQQDVDGAGAPVSDAELGPFETFDLLYVSLCALLYNYVPTSGHPGGSISSGRIVAGILFDAMDYDLADPDREDADVVSYAAGHKAMGLYSMWALRNEIARVGAPGLLPRDERRQLRLEDLLGFRRNPASRTPLLTRFGAKALDGHPTPHTPFVRLATGASGVGLASSVGMALAARDAWGADAPRIHVVEGEGGLTPGRASEALAAAGTARLDNLVLHVDWNQASIDSDRVCRDADGPGDYVQWDPVELAYLHDWNVVEVPDGFAFPAILAAQRRAGGLDSGQPTAIVYRTIKGYRYGIEGRASHGAGHKLCSDGFYEALSPLLDRYQESLPTCCDVSAMRCAGPDGDAVVEECFWDALEVVRNAVERESAMVDAMARRLVRARERLDARRRRPREGGPDVARVFEAAERSGDGVPTELQLAPGTVTTLRGELGRALEHYNRESAGAMFVASADLLSSTSVDAAARGFAPGYFNAVTNPRARLLSAGGICEDAISGIISGLSSYGRHVGVGSSYAAFLAALGHVSARLHAIGCQARQRAFGDPYTPMVLVCAHAGVKTGEDGPTHADPQALQLLQDNFPPGTAVTLTPWDPAEVWPLLTEALRRRPAVIAPFVTRPPESVPDRDGAGLAPASRAVTGVYRLREARGTPDGTVVLQGSGVTLAFVEHALPRLVTDGVNLEVIYVASAELFDALSESERESIFPEERAREAIGITGFTLPTLDRWVRSARGRGASLHPFRNGHFLGSGQADRVMREAGLDGESQYRAVLRFVERPVRT